MHIYLIDKPFNTKFNDIFYDFINEIYLINFTLLISNSSTPFSYLSFSKTINRSFLSEVNFIGNLTKLSSATVNSLSLEDPIISP